MLSLSWEGRVGAGMSHQAGFGSRRCGHQLPEAHETALRTSTSQVNALHTLLFCQGWWLWCHLFLLRSSAAVFVSPAPPFKAVTLTTFILQSKPWTGNGPRNRPCMVVPSVCCSLGAKTFESAQITDESQRSPMHSVDTNLSLEIHTQARLTENFTFWPFKLFC